MPLQKFAHLAKKVGFKLTPAPSAAQNRTPLSRTTRSTRSTNSPTPHVAISAHPSRGRIRVVTVGDNGRNREESVFTLPEGMDNFPNPAEDHPRVEPMKPGPVPLTKGAKRRDIVNEVFLEGRVEPFNPNTTLLLDLRSAPKAPKNKFLSKETIAACLDTVSKEVGIPLPSHIPREASWGPYRSSLKLQLPPLHATKLSTFFKDVSRPLSVNTEGLDVDKAFIELYDPERPAIDLANPRLWVTTFKLKVPRTGGLDLGRSRIKARLALHLLSFFKTLSPAPLKLPRTSSLQGIINVLNATKRGNNIYGYVALHGALFKGFGPDPMQLWKNVGQPIKGGFAIAALDDFQGAATTLRSPARILKRKSKAKIRTQKGPRDAPGVNDGWRTVMRGNRHRAVTEKERAEIESSLPQSPASLPSSATTTPQDPPLTTATIQDPEPLKEEVDTLKTELARQKLKNRTLLNRIKALEEKLAFSSATPDQADEDVGCAIDDGADDCFVDIDLVEVDGQ